VITKKSKIIDMEFNQWIQYKKIAKDVGVMIDNMPLLNFNEITQQLFIPAEIPFMASPADENAYVNDIEKIELDPLLTLICD
jgi:hypothetical protein